MTLLRMAALTAALSAAAAPAFVAGSGLHALHPWSRPVPPAAPTGVGYLTLVNETSRPERLLGGDSPALRGGVEVHEMSMTGGVMRMRPVPGGLLIPAHGRAELRPGGAHLMLIGPKRAYKPGALIPVTLRFDHAPPLPVSLQVQAQTPASMNGMGMR